MVGYFTRSTSLRSGNWRRRTHRHRTTRREAGGGFITRRIDSTEIMRTENWKDVPGFEGFYQASDLGNVRSVPREIVTSDSRRWIQPGKRMTLGAHHKGGYRTVVLCRFNKPRAYLVHRLVALAFLENPDGLPEVNHKDGDKAHNAVSNLEWISRKDNIDHAVCLSLINNKGERNQQAKLNEATVRHIRRLKSQGLSNTKIAALTGATARNVKNITSRTSWKHIEEAAA